MGEGPCSSPEATRDDARETRIIKGRKMAHFWILFLEVVSWEVSLDNSPSPYRVKLGTKDTGTQRDWVMEVWLRILDKVWSHQK